MAINEYNCDNINIDYDQLKALSSKVTLGLYPHAAMMLISRRSVLHGVKEVRSIRNAALVWRWFYISMGVLGIYLCLAVSWWWLILVISCIKMFSDSDRAAAMTFCTHALRDKDLYESIRGCSAWLYHIEETDAKPYMIDKGR